VGNYVGLSTRDSDRRYRISISLMTDILSVFGKVCSHPLTDFHSSKTCAKSFKMQT
jgi:hypothetical protein